MKIAKLLKNVALQMAAEAFLRESNAEVLDDSRRLKARLQFGNGHASKFTAALANEFAANVTVLDQFQNDIKLKGNTGFSGTLFRDNADGTLTLSFRSTEAVDDDVRDSKSTNELEIKDLGWALGQISEMEDWYQNVLLKSPDLLKGKKFNVTGYSLGGHLATAFNILRREEAAATGGVLPVLATVTFNGAGTGDLKNGVRLTDVLKQFRDARDNPGAYQWASPVIRRLFDLSRADGVTSDELARVMNAARSSGRFSGDAKGLQDAELLASAIDRVLKIRAEEMRVADPGFNATFAFPDARPPAGVQADVAYQVAALLAARNTTPASTFPLPGGTNTVPTSPVFVGVNRDFPLMTEVVGNDGGSLGPSFVSNSGLHWGQRQLAYIEDQPLTRGTFIVRAIDLEFLVNNPAENDFADTHSLVLLVDSLSLMEVMERIDPAVTMEAIGAALAASSSERGVAKLGTQGKAEGDTLERVANSLARLIGIGDDPGKWAWLQGSPDGNTWHSTGNVNQFSGREEFHQGLDSLRKAIAEAAVRNARFVSLEGYSAERLGIEAARKDETGVAIRYALKYLNAYAFTGDFAAYRSNQYSVYVRDAAIEGMTSEYIADRAAMMAWKSKINRENLVFGRIGGAEVWRFADLDGLRPFDTYFALNDVVLDLEGARALFALRESGGKGHHAVFGTMQADAVMGGRSDDRLYGDGGADVVDGRAGADYLEGGTGQDVYVYRINKNVAGVEVADGDDVVRDADGKGVIRLARTREPGFPGAVVQAEDSSSLLGGFFFKSAAQANVWESLDRRLAITKIAGRNAGGIADGTEDLVVTFKSSTGAALSGSITIKAWREGDLSIRLLDAESLSDPQFGRLIPGGELATAVVLDDLGNRVLVPDTVAANVANELNGSAATDKFDAGGGNDNIRADLVGNTSQVSVGGDWIVAGDGRDWVRSGSGADLIEGGADGDFVAALAGDFIVAGDGNDRVFGDRRITLSDGITLGDGVTYGLTTGVQAASGRKGDLVLAGLGDDVVVSTVGDDVLFGGGGRDVLIGGAGRDTLFGDGNAKVVGSYLTTPNWTLRLFQRGYTLEPDQVSTPAAAQYTGAFIGRYLEIGVDDPQVGAADTIYAGAGDDFVSSQGGDDVVDGGSGDDVIDGGAGADILSGGLGNDYISGDDAGEALALHGGDVIDGGAGADVLFGMGGDDILIGGAGDDWLEGGKGGDILIGGAGNDTLRGGSGKDTYIFNRGDGVEIIIDPDDRGGDPAARQADRSRDKSVIVLGEGIRRQDVKFRPGSLMIDMGGGDAIHLELPDGQSDPSATRIFDRIEFADGAALSFDDVLALGFDIDGTERIAPTVAPDGSLIPGQDGNDILAGTANAACGDRIRGFSGDDILYGKAGDDRLDGGAGKDALWGGEGADTYVFNADGGLDYLNDAQGTSTLEFGAGIDAQSLRLAVWSGFDFRTGVFTDFLGIAYGAAASGARVDIVNGLRLGATRYRFADGSERSQADLLAALSTPINITGAVGADTLAGGAGADYLFGRGGDDTLFGGGGADHLVGDDGADISVGGAGDDALQGGAGDDTYVFARGDGVDVIDDTQGANTVTFGPGIVPGSVRASLANGTDGANYLRLDVLDDAGGYGDALFVRIAFDPSQGAGTPMRFRFDDGTALDARQLLSTAFTAPLDFRGGADGLDLTGSAFGDRIEGGAASDRIDGAGGADVLYGAAGDDHLYGSDGDDVLIGGAGDDTLDGGAGADTYRIERGMGRDVVFEIPDGTNTLLLGDGVEFTDLTFRKVDGDLVVGIRDSDDAATLRDQVPAAVDWQFQNARGDSVSLSRLMGTVVQAPAPAGVEQMAAAFEARLVNFYRAALQQGGYQAAGGGVFVRDAREGSVYAAVHEVDTVILGRIVLSLDGRVDVASSPAALHLLTSTSSQTSERKTITITDPGASTFVSFRNGGNLGGAVDGSYLLDISYVEAAGAGRSWGRAEPVFGDKLVMGVGGLQREIIGLRVQGAVGGLVRGVRGNVAPPPPRTITQTVTTTNTERANFWALDVLRVTGTDGDDRLDIGGGTLVDGGAGNDVIRVVAAGELPGHASASRDTSAGGFLYGGTGDDTLGGGSADDVLVAGPGNDLLSGGGGGDRYLILPEAGVASLWELTGVAKGDAPASAPDLVELPEGVRLADLHLEWSDELLVLDRNATWRYGATYIRDLPLRVLTSVLTLRWGDSGTGPAVRIWMPHSDDNAADGIEAVHLSDGTVLSRSDLLRLAPHNLDANRADNVIVADNVDGDAGDDRLTGNGVLRGGAGDDVLVGGAGNDSLTGDDGSDTLIGGDGEDVLGFSTREWVGGGNTYRGGPGDDLILGSRAADLYLFERGDGADTVGDFAHRADAVALSGASFIDPLTFGGFGWSAPYADSIFGFDYGPAGEPVDYAGFDTLRLGTGIQPGEVRFLRPVNHILTDLNGKVLAVDTPGMSDDDLYVVVGDGADRVGFAGFFSDMAFGFDPLRSLLARDWYLDRNPLGRIEFADGTSWGREEIDARASPLGNRRPVVQRGFSQSLAVGQAYEYVIAADLLHDPNPNDHLTYEFSGYAARGFEVLSGKLPGWLDFDAATGRFAGTPGTDDIADVEITVRATDAEGLDADARFTLHVAAAAPLAQPFSFLIPAADFGRVLPGDTISYAVEALDAAGLPAPLPDWLRFNEASRMLEGTPAPSDQGVVHVRVTPTDRLRDESYAWGFDIRVGDGNAAPAVHELAAVEVVQDAPFTIAIPEAMVASTGPVRYQAQLLDRQGRASALPAWLGFDADSLTLHGVADNAAVGEYRLRVTAMDNQGEVGRSELAFSVGNVNDAPRATVSGGDVAVEAGQTTLLYLPADAFRDPDAQDSLAVRAEWAVNDGTTLAPLPDWLSFDPATMALAMSPGIAQAGQWRVRFTAEDAAGAAAAVDYRIAVAGPGVDGQSAGPPSPGIPDPLQAIASVPPDEPVTAPLVMEPPWPASLPGASMQGTAGGNSLPILPVGNAVVGPGAASPFAPVGVLGAPTSPPPLAGDRSSRAQIDPQVLADALAAFDAASGSGASSDIPDTSPQAIESAPEPDFLSPASMIDGLVRFHLAAQRAAGADFDVAFGAFPDLGVIIGANVPMPPGLGTEAARLRGFSGLAEGFERLAV